MDTVPEESLFPGVLWMIADVECIDITTRLDIGTIDLGTGAVVEKISRIFGWIERFHMFYCFFCIGVILQLSRLTRISQRA